MKILSKFFLSLLGISLSFLVRAANESSGNLDRDSARVSNAVKYNVKKIKKRKMRKQKKKTQKQVNNLALLLEGMDILSQSATDEQLQEIDTEGLIVDI